MIATRAEAITPMRGTSRLTVVGLGFMVVAIALLSGTLETLDRPTVAVVWGGLALAAYCAGLLCLVGSALYRDLGLARWKIGPWILLWCGVAFGICTVTWSQPQNGTPAQIAVSSVLRALWLIAVGMSGWAFGYLVGPGHSARRVASRAVGRLGKRFAAEVRSPAAPWILCAIGIAASLALTATTGVFGYIGDPSSLVSSATSYGGILGALGLCGSLALSAAALQVFRERLRGARITLLALLLVELAFGVAQGNKENFIVAVLAVVIPFSGARRRLPKIMVIASILVFLVIIIPFNHAYRDTARQGSNTLSPSQAVSVAPGILKQTVIDQSVVTILPESIDYLMQRIRQIDSTAIIVQRTPDQFGFLSPVGLVEGPIAGMVPRSIWSNKPINLTGYQFSQEYFGLPSTAYTSTAETTVGGLYMYGGWITVVVGMFLLGCAVRLLDDVLDVRANPHAIFPVLLLFPSLVEGQENWQTILAAIPGIMFVWLLAVVLTFRARRRT